ncbi:MAG: ECF-type sigma factor [Acidobacteriota bacterium]
MAEITRLLEAWAEGDELARERLFEVVYPELHRLAASKLFAEPTPPSIQATELVNEAYLKLVEQSSVSWQSRAQFLALSATLIRRILLDRAKSRGRSKRGSGKRPLSLDLVETPVEGRPVELLALDAALVDLARIQPVAARLVELRYFGGLSVEETADVLGLGTATVVRRWRFAKAWLAERLGGTDDD